MKYFVEVDDALCTSEDVSHGIDLKSISLLDGSGDADEEAEEVDRLNDTSHLF